MASPLHLLPHRVRGGLDLPSFVCPDPSCPFPHSHVPPDSTYHQAFHTWPLRLLLPARGVALLPRAALRSPAHVTLLMGWLASH